MRLQQRGRVTVTCRGRDVQSAVRPLSGILSARRYGEYVQDMLRLLLPCDVVIAPGDRISLSGTPYVCVHVRSLAGHIQADVRRCAR